MACCAASGSKNHFPGDFSSQDVPCCKGDVGPHLSLCSYQPTPWKSGSRAGWRLSVKSRNQLSSESELGLGWADSPSFYPG